MFTASVPVGRMRGHDVDAVRAANEMRMGSMESEPNVWQVNPTGPSGVEAVTTTTPVAK